MGKVVRSYEVEDLKKVNTELYQEGDFFRTAKQVGTIVKGKMLTFSTSRPNLNSYAKKEDIEKMFEDFYKQKVEVKK